MTDARKSHFLSTVFLRAQHVRYLTILERPTSARRYSARAPSVWLARLHLIRTAISATPLTMLPQILGKAKIRRRFLAKTFCESPYPEFRLRARKNLSRSNGHPDTSVLLVTSNGIFKRPSIRTSSGSFRRYSAHFGDCSMGSDCIMCYKIIKVYKNLAKISQNLHTKKRPPSS